MVNAVILDQRHVDLDKAVTGVDPRSQALERIANDGSEEVHTIHEHSNLHAGETLIPSVSVQFLFSVGNHSLFVVACWVTYDLINVVSYHTP